MNILHLEDNPRDAELARELLLSEWPDCHVTRAATRPDCLVAMRRGGYDLILSDFSMISFDGLDALRLAQEHLPRTPFIFFSGTIGEERALEVVRAGALDYVLKDNVQRLVPSVRRALHDNDQRHRREEAERRLREQADIIDRASESIVVSDLDGCITSWNRGAERLYGVPATEAVGRTAEELFPGAILQKLQAARELTRETAGEWQGEIDVVTRDGREVVIDLHMTLIRDDAGQPKARLSIATDITEKKRLEAQFLHAQRLESLGLLAAGIAHDLNNVLAPVLMAAPLLRVRAHDAGDIRTLDILEKSAERGAGLVRQILGFAHSAHGGLQLVQVKHLIRDVGEVIAASFSKAITFDEHVPSDLWPIQANPTQIHQILLNLCVNARDAMLPGGGTLRLRAENRVLDEASALVIEGARPGPFLVIEVTDTGTGIAPDVLTRIWEPFFTTKPKGLGTGLGLSTVRGVVAGHGGFISVKTAIGRGTTFCVYLPAARQSGGAMIESAAKAVPRGRNELILVVDDESTVRDLTTAVLTRHGYRVVSGADGVEAIALFTQHAAEIRLVVTDVNMPNLDGHALALVLKRLQPKVKILAVTGLGSGDAFSSAKPAEFAAVTLQKPFTTEALLLAVNRLLNVERKAG